MCVCVCVRVCACKCVRVCACVCACECVYALIIFFEIMCVILHVRTHTQRWGGGGGGGTRPPYNDIAATYIELLLTERKWKRRTLSMPSTFSWSTTGDRLLHCISGTVETSSLWNESSS